MRPALECVDILENKDHLAHLVDQVTRGHQVLLGLPVILVGQAILVLLGPLEPLASLVPTVHLAHVVAQVTRDRQESLGLLVQLVILVIQATLALLAPLEALAPLVHMDYLVHLVNLDALVRQIRRFRTVIRYVHHCFTAYRGQSNFY